MVEARSRRPAGTHRPAARLGRAGLPPRLRAPGRHPRPRAGSSHDLCLYGLDILSDLWSVLYLQPERTPRTAVRPGRIPGPHPARPGRPATDRNRPAAATPCPAPAGGRHDRRHPPPGPGLRPPRLARLPLPARPERSPPPSTATSDATTDEQQITEWFGRGQRWNLAIATGAPGPDVLDIDQHGQAGNGYPAYAQLHRAGLLNGADAYVRTPADGMHAYFAGSDQHNGRLPSHHLDFRVTGGYILAPPSQVGGKPYRLISRPGGHGILDWAAVTTLLEPQRNHEHPTTGQAPDRRLGQLTARMSPASEGVHVAAGSRH